MQPNIYIFFFSSKWGNNCIVNFDNYRNSNTDNSIIGSNDGDDNVFVITIIEIKMVRIFYNDKCKPFSNVNNVIDNVNRG